MPLARPRRRSSDFGPEGHRWTFERRISLDTIVGIAGIALVLGGPFIVWGRAMEGRVLAIEVRDEQRAKTFEQITKSLERMNEQLTQLQIAVGVMTAPAVRAGNR